MLPFVLHMLACFYDCFSERHPYAKAPQGPDGIFFVSSRHVECVVKLEKTIYEVVTNLAITHKS